MMNVEIKPTNERECTNVVPLALCFALLVTATGVALIYGSNDDSLKSPQNSSLITTDFPTIYSSTTPKSVPVQPTEASHEPSFTSTTIAPVATSTILPHSKSKSKSKVKSTQSPKNQETDDKGLISPDSSNLPITEASTDKTAVAEFAQSTTLASANPEPTETTTILPEIIAPTPSITPPFEASTKSQIVPITMTTSTSTESSTKHELMPTPQPLKASTHAKRTKRNTNLEDLTLTTSTISSNSASESLPTTTLLATLATVPLKTGDPTKKPENRFYFYESTTKGMDATTTTQMNLPTTRVGIETTTQTSFESTTQAAATTASIITSTKSPDSTTNSEAPKPTTQESYLIAWHLVASMSFVSLIFSYIFLVLFGRSAKSVIWIINAALVIFFCSFAGLSEMADYRLVAIFSLITGIVLLLLMFWYRVRINAVAKFLKECCIVFVDVPGLKYEPIVTIITIAISYIIFYKFYKSIPLSVSNDLQIFPLFIITATFIWTTQFALSCQHFVVSGTVLRWFFNRDKTKVKEPVKSSLSHLIRFHLGSACLGSLLIWLGKVFRIVLFPFRTTEGTHGNLISNIASCCCIKPIKAFDEVTQYLAPRAYVFVAKDGVPFLKSGKQAYNLVSQRIMDIIALAHYGDIALFACKILIAVISAVVGYPAIWMKTDQQYSRKLSLTIGGVFAFIIAHCILMLIEVTADTILVCFCIDCENNNGLSSSYFMSNEIMKSIKDMKECVGGSLNVESGGMATGSSAPMLSSHSQKRNKKRKPSGGVSRLYD
ncbi:hypothetical protein ACKWTF_015289 [Chironomus riparius]